MVGNFDFLIKYDRPVGVAAISYDGARIIWNTLYASATGTRNYCLVGSAPSNHLYGTRGGQGSLGGLQLPHEPLFSLIYWLKYSFLQLKCDRNRLILKYFTNNYEVQDWFSLFIDNSTIDISGDRRRMRFVWSDLGNMYCWKRMFWENIMCLNLLSGPHILLYTKHWKGSLYYRFVQFSTAKKYELTFIKLGIWKYFDHMYFGGGGVYFDNSKL